MALQFQQEWHRIRHLYHHTVPKLSRPLTTISGALLTGAFLVGFASFQGNNPANGPQAFRENLWLSNGLVRQAIIDLYRIQRSQQQEPASAPAETATSASANADTSPPPSTTASTPPQPEKPAPPAAAATDANVIDQALEMRVAIARNQPALVVGTNTSGWVINTDGSAHCSIAAQSSLTAYPNSRGIAFGDCQLTTAAWLEAEAGGYVFVEDSWYRGRVLLLNNGGQLLAVNFVLLGNYLASVVGSEMYHHWPLEAFKAQAVAARSYALTHHIRPASDYFDLDNTQRFQAYKGIAMETANTQRAVAETAGEFISYDGGIVESLYAASDQIVQEAHGGQGMSQHGANDFAKQGFSYEQILGAYYPGTGLARLVVE